jgi:hypothetical protein
MEEYMRNMVVVGVDAGFEDDGRVDVEEERVEMFSRQLG